MPDHLAVGTRVRLTRPVERYPLFTAPKGAIGTVTVSGPDVVAMKLDELLEGAEDWNNEVIWYPSNGDFPNDDMAVVDV